MFYNKYILQYIFIITIDFVLLQVLNVTLSRCHCHDSVSNLQKAHHLTDFYRLRYPEIWSRTENVVPLHRHKRMA